MPSRRRECVRFAMHLADARRRWRELRWFFSVAWNCAKGLRRREKRAVLFQRITRLSSSRFRIAFSRLVYVTTYGEIDEKWRWSICLLFWMDTVRKLKDRQVPRLFARGIYFLELDQILVFIIKFGRSWEKSMTQVLCKLTLISLQK